MGSMHEGPPIWPPIEGNRIAVQHPDGRDDFHTVFEGRDDEDYLRKLKTMTRWTSIASAAFFAVDFAFMEREFHYMTLVRRGPYWGIPFIGGGITYVSVVAATAAFRKKDGPLNHFIAGMCVGALVGSRCKRSVAYTGILCGIGIGFMGAMYKTGKLQGFEMFPFRKNRERGYIFPQNSDLTRVQDFPAYWVREAPATENEVISK